MQTKLCTKCGEQKPHALFNKHSTTKDRLHSYCKVCHGKCSRQWSLKNQKAVKEQSKKYIQKNPEKYNAFNAKRRAAKLQRTPPWLTQEQLAEIETFYTVALAFKIFTGLTYHVDHIVPLQGKNVSGLHVPWNLQVISATDNLKKYNLFED